MKNINFPILILLLALYSCAGRGTSYEATRKDLGELEKQSPKEFLTVEFKTWENLIGELVIEGEIKSSASLTKFKDAVLIVKFFTKTQTQLGSENYVIYEFVDPGKSVPFKIKLISPKGTDSISIEISDVAVAE